jgi:6-carboxyhexanoate--CoA ligase
MLASLTMSDELFSVRMRAGAAGRHLSGGERIVARQELEAAVAELFRRALDRGASVDEIQCRAERIDRDEVRRCRLPDIIEHRVVDWRKGRALAVDLLVRSGVAGAVAAGAVELLAAGPGPAGSIMRGAVLMDAASGERCETDPARGVRVSRMDLAPSCRAELRRRLGEAGLGHHRVAEALVLAGKVSAAPGVVAELCWSDDIAYTTGYVASARCGYQRILPLKAAADGSGGRIIFFERQAVDLDQLVTYLERRPVLFDAPGRMTRAAGGS